MAQRPTLRQRLTSRIRAIGGSRTVLEVTTGGVTATRLKVERSKVAVFSRETREPPAQGPRRGGAQTLRAALASGLVPSGQEVAVSLPRHLAIVKWLSLPTVPDDELRDMVIFQAEKVIPFPLKRVSLAYQVVGATPDGGQRVVLVAVENAVVDAHKQELLDAGLEPRCLTVSSLAAVRAALDWDRGIGDECTMLLRLARDTVELDLIDQRSHRFGRAAALSALRDDPEAWFSRLVSELKRTATAYRSQGGAACTGMVVYGPLADDDALLARLSSALGQPCRRFAGESLPGDAHTLPIALGLSRGGCPDLLTGLQPVVKRSRVPWLVAALLAILLPLGFWGYTRLTSLEAEVAALEVEVAGLTERAERYHDAEQAIAVVREWNDGRATATDILHALATRLNSKVYLRHLSYVAGSALRLDATAVDATSVPLVPVELTAAPMFADARTENFTRNERGGKAVFDFNLELEVE